MYRHFYQFSKKPFDVTPDPKFLYMSRNHQETLASIIYGIRERKGFIAVIGEVGTGKTTLLNAALESLDKEIKSAFIFNTDVTFEELLMTVLMDLGLAKTQKTLPKYLALDQLNQYATKEFSSGGNIVIFIDEAQNLNSRTMENLRLLSNLETTKYKLIQIVLSGQPELDEKLRQNELRQLAQRINLRRYITPLNKADTFKYVRHHLNVAEYTGKKLFKKASLKQIWKYSKGVPRKINILCDNALLIGFGLGKKTISKSIVKEAIKDLSWSPYIHYTNVAQRKREVNQQKPQKLMRRFAYASLVLTLGFFLGAGAFHQWQFLPGIMKKLPHMAIQMRTDFPAIPPPYSPPANKEEKNSNASRIPRELSSLRDHQPTPEASGKIENKHELRQVLPTRTDYYNEASSRAAAHFDDAPESMTINNFNNVVVEFGDTLSWIIQERYGEYQNMLPKVIQANPELQNPDFIIPGQIIRLPRIDNPNEQSIKTTTPSS